MKNLLKNEGEELTERKGLLTHEVLNFKEASVLLGISPSTLYKLTHKRAITFYKPGGKLIFFRREDLMKWMLQNVQPSNDEVLENVLTNLKDKKNGERNYK